MTSKEIQGTSYGLARNMQAQKEIRGMLHQVVCEKHDYVTVTQTTSTMVGGMEVKNTKKNWIQCRKCGKTLSTDGQL
jgi:hypothetical protein